MGEEKSGRGRMKICGHKCAWERNEEGGNYHCKNTVGWLSTSFVCTWG